MKKIIKDIISILTVILLVNIFSFFIFFRWDFTKTKRYSLSKVSKTSIRNNVEPIVVDFYVTEDLPQDTKKLVKEFRSLLKEYKSLSNVSFTINTIYPDNTEKEFKATQEGIIPSFNEIRERDLEKIQKIYCGAVFHIGNNKTVLPNISFNTPIEYEITRMLKQASDTIKPRIGFVRGHGETTLNLMSELVDELSHLTDITVVDLNLNTYEDCNVLCLINPKDNFSPYEIAQLEKFLSKGGRLFIALNHAIGLLDHPNNGYINSTGVEDMLEKKGLKIRNDFIIDNNCGVCNFEQQYGYLKFQRSVSFPYCPVITNFSKHTITYGLRSMLLMFASSIEQIKTPTPYIFTPLAQSSSISGVQQAPVCFDLEKQWTQRDFNRPHNIVAALLTNDDNNSAIVTITDADFLINQSAIDGHTDNITFALNSIEWLADNSGLIQLRNKFTTFPVLEPVGILPDYMEPIGVGMPVDLLMRRPDVRSAERSVNAQAALLGASKADWLPKVFLKGSFGYAARDLKDLTKSKSMMYEIAPSMSWTLFSGGQLVNATRLAKAQLDESINQFNQTVLTAVQETDNAMNSYRNSIKQIVALREVRNQGIETLKLSLELYKQGLSPFQNVLDAQRSLLSYENQLVQAQGNSLLQLITLYKALGGGWQE